MIPNTLHRAVIAVITCFIAGSDFGQISWNRVSSFAFDWDGHKGVRVVLEIPPSRTDPGDFTRIRVLVPGQQDFTLSSKEGWVKYGSEEASASPGIRGVTNLLGSPYVLALKIAQNRTALFLLGYSYASSPGSLDVLEISDTGQPTVVLHREELGLKEVRDLDGDGLSEIVGYPCLSQEFGNGLLTYDPLNVYTFGTALASRAALSVPLSKSYNLKHYYGWAGAKCSEDFAVVLHPPKGGKPLVMTTKEAEKLTEK
ncbi:hypothetical protein [Occallatibacter savannae]|uniref:hypothetical protein n=1 Tax=Occallatibacter savannae TaxID=1002691 RepID=UPI000D693FE2|nr:hypothetical protein [Occallatibacter savannae]